MPAAAAATQELPAWAQGTAMGTARLRVWGLDIYDARLWAPAPLAGQDYASQRFALELRYLRAFKGRAIAERSLQEMRRVDSFSDSQARDWLDWLSRVLPDVAAGDRLTGLHQPDAGLQLFYNGQPLAHHPDTVLARLFMGIWLSPRSAEPALRDALLAPARP